jgi:hypothetical protein
MIFSVNQVLFTEYFMMAVSALSMFDPSMVTSALTICAAGDDGNIMLLVVNEQLLLFTDQMPGLTVPHDIL